MSKEFPLLKDKILFNDNILKYDYLRSNYCELLLDWEDNFKKYYKKEVVNEEKLNKALKIYSDEFNRILDFSVFILMENDIDYIDQSKFFDMIKEEFAGFDPFHAVQMSINAIATASEELAKKIQATRAAERNNRSYWEGGGFGVKGAVKGALTAGALNIATSAIRGVGDSITDSYDKSKFNKFIKDALQNSEYGIQDSFVMSTRLNYFYCLITIYRFLIKQRKMSEFNLNIDSYEAKINNYMNFGNINDAYNLLMKSIQINPYSINLYKHLYILADKIAVNNSEKERFKEDIDGLYEYFRPDIFEF